MSVTWRKEKSSSAVGAKCISVVQQMLRTYIVNAWDMINGQRKIHQIEMRFIWILTCRSYGAFKILLNHSYRHVAPTELWKFFSNTRKRENVSSHDISLSESEDLSDRMRFIWILSFRSTQSNCKSFAPAFARKIRWTKFNEDFRNAGVGGKKVKSLTIGKSRFPRLLSGRTSKCVR